MNNLYNYVNGPWLKTHVIPADQPMDGTFHQLRDEAEEHVHGLVSQDDGLAGTLFASFMDVAAINAAGVDGLREDLAALQVDTPLELARAMGELNRVGVGGPLGFYITKDSDGELDVPYVYQSGLGLPDEAYYREPIHAETLSAYREHVPAMLAFLDPQWLGGLTPQEAAARIVDLETALAAGHWDVVQSRDAVKTYNPTPLGELPATVQALLQGAGLADDATVVNCMPSYTTHLAELLDARELADWRLLMTLQVLHARAPFLPEEVGRQNFAFYGTVLSGTPEQRDRWKRGIGVVNSAVGEDVGKLYVEHYFPASAKSQMEELVGYLIGAYRSRLGALPWMTEQTKNRALEKLEKFRAKIGYPDEWRSYAGLEFGASGADLLGNIRRAAACEHDYELAKVGHPTNRDEWVTTPQTVNAFYNPVVNDITFPAAILRPPFFDPEADAAENFGAIGAVIGHEIGHGFDDQGSRYDGEGNLRSWWTDEDRAAFTKLTAKLVSQFQGLQPTVLRQNGIESPGVNGELTLGENIGDLGGLGIALIAYRDYLADRGLDFDSAPHATFAADGGSVDMQNRSFSGVQRFFLAWARAWRTAIRPEMAMQLLSVDPHSPAEFRCNVIAANVDEFYRAFPKTTPDSDMYIAPEDRVTIW